MQSKKFHSFVATVGLILLGTLFGRCQEGRGVDPYWPGLHSPKLITPQWIGEEGVEAAILLSIDDMRDPAKYESFCRPILNRLKEIDGRAPLTIFTNVVDPMEPQLQSWLKEGLSIEVHTISHPCPLLDNGDFAQAKKTVHDCIDLLAGIPGMKPVAYRMPCCDSMNSVSPRFYREIFSVPTESGNFLQIDSSVFNLMTADDAELPADLIGEGAGRFTKYVPKLRGFVNYIENYPYPYVIGGSCWQLPCVVPSDWEAQDRQGANNPDTVADMKAAIDATVIKKGVFTLVFHPHGWIRNDQIVELIDHAVSKHGKKVKFLNMRETLERLTGNFLGGTPIRDPASGKTNEQIAILDGDADGFMEVAVRPEQASPIVFKDLDGDGVDEVVSGHADGPGVYRKEGEGWQRLPFTLPYRTSATTPDGKDAGLRFADVNGDGHDDVVFSNHERYSVHLWVSMDAGWAVGGLSGTRGDFPADQGIPMIVREDGSDNGTWFKAGRMFVQNEDTVKGNTVVEQRTFEQLATALTKPEAVVNLQPTPADRALATMRTHDRFEVQLVAAEPLVMDPIDIAWGADGKLWVVEMGDYPLGEDGKGKPDGRVRFLEDVDGDGNYEKSTLFLEGLAYPSGVMPWKDGVLVLAVPNLLFARDVNGDGLCDTREVLYDGFLTGNPQHLANGLVWGLDNWIYIANGDSGGEVRSLKTGETANISGRDVRLRLDTGTLDAQSGMTQFSRPRDDWGNWFGCNNSFPLWHYVLHDHYLRRNPHVATPSPSIRITDPELHPQVYPASPTIERFNDYHTANRITSACGAGIYRDTLLGEDLYGNAFICEPVHNLVYRQVVSPDGYTFKARRPDEEQQSEFLASTDNWFRPVTALTGPDGALYVVDMYRHVIEHPEWIPPEWEEKLDLRAGHDRGRIYRVVKRGTTPRKVPVIAGMNVPDLVALLGSENGELRDLVHQQLLQSATVEDSAKASLVNLVRSGQRPAARLHALAVLDGIGQLDDDVLRAALKDPTAPVRREAIRLSEGRARLLVDMEAMDLAGEDLSVLLQLASSAGEFSEPKAGELLGALLARHGGNHWMLAAIMSSATHHAGALTDVLIAQNSTQLKPLLPAVESMIALNAAVSPESLLPKLAKGNWGRSVSSGFQHSCCRCH
ncbi:MAG: FG-GAP-like repeat-containing protein [Verrucomicrobia bacterium]|nr:FG-GAP-like repeat-containing protein [Verrucomicrobiota bacterium]